jgi:hypothetical protein
VGSLARILHCIILIWITDIYNDSSNSNKVSGWAKVRHGASQGCVLGPVPKVRHGASQGSVLGPVPKLRHGASQGSVLGPVLFLPYINDLPKIINKTLAPIIFADDTSILFAQSNLINLNKNIHIVFATLCKWFRANQLSLNFKRTNYVHFTAKRNMSVNFKIGFNNNFITNSSYTKFLGVTMDNTPSWDNHIDLFMKKVSTACYISISIYLAFV